MKPLQRRRKGFISSAERFPQPEREPWWKNLPIVFAAASLVVSGLSLYRVEMVGRRDQQMAVLQTYGTAAAKITQALNRVDHLQAAIFQYAGQITCLDDKIATGDLESILGQIRLAQESLYPVQSEALGFAASSYDAEMLLKDILRTSSDLDRVLIEAQGAIDRITTAAVLHARDVAEGDGFVPDFERKCIEERQLERERAAAG